MSRLDKVIDACNYHGLKMQANNPDGKYLRIEIWGAGFTTRFFKGIKAAEQFLDGYDLGVKSIEEI